ncbi:(2E,6E)-farnesyl diphosphate synthase [Candidatus Fukatsuia anoeciicola]|uniref:(2E,6E)-farnesyl diphosphate synthase n=1 Tax=Candidatus Fukatsuia anoeciicola TaxID=2994492 RepID=UPI003463BEB6
MSNLNSQLITYQQRVDQTLKNFINELPFQNSQLVQAIRYGTLLGGKRVRPCLVYATGEMFNLPLNSLDAAAAAIECMHAYSLIHDDLPAMDNDNYRRGQQSCHIKFSEADAILAGDALQTLAFSILTDKPMPNVTLKDRLAMLSELAQSSGAAGMCAGQSLDIISKNCQISLASLEQIHRNKTGSLIRAAIRIGALAAGKRRKNALLLLDKYAEAIGLAFQVQDDILDIIGETNRIDKQKCFDQQFSKNTYPALLGFDTARIKVKDLYREALLALDSLSVQSYNPKLLYIMTDFIIKRNN